MTLAVDNTFVFVVILALTGIKLLLQRSHEMHPERNPLVRAVQKILPVTPDFVGDKFTVVRNGWRHATPLLLALVAVEVTDLIFAVDSIPPIFAVTTDPFIVSTSNIFAILGLRSLYFLLAGVIEKFVCLEVGLSFVLSFVGAKMLLMDVDKIPITTSLAVIASIFGLSIAASFLKRPGGPSPTGAPPTALEVARVARENHEPTGARPRTTDTERRDCMSSG